MANGKTKILAVSSGGGHWVQLLRLRPAFAGCDVVYATVREGYRSDLPPDARFRRIPEANRWNKIGVVRALCAVFWLVWRERPDVVISTGAAQGYLAIRIGRLFGARTVWIDSIANSEELSLSGQKVGPHANLWLTQWEHLARSGGPRYGGSVL